MNHNRRPELIVKPAQISRQRHWAHQIITGFLILALPVGAYASSVIKVGQPLPPLQIDDGGRVVLTEDDYTVAPWEGPTGPGLVQVYQYVPGTRSGSGLFDALTERMQHELDVERYRITALVNLEVTANLIKPFVRSAVVDEQRTFTLATLVLDEAGAGQKSWDLTENAAFIVIDRKGLVVDAILGPPADKDLQRVFDVLRELVMSGN